MKFHFDSYVKNWKRKNQSEPAAKKQKLESRVEDERQPEVEVKPEVDEKKVENPVEENGTKIETIEEDTKDPEPMENDNDSDSEDVIQERLRSASSEQGLKMFHKIVPFKQPGDYKM